MKRLYFEKLGNLTVNMDHVVNVWIRKKTYKNADDREITEYSLIVWYISQNKDPFLEYPIKDDEILKYVRDVLQDFRGD